MTIDQLGLAKIKHLQRIHDLKSYQNACRVVNQLKPYVHETYYEKEKIVYLNKEGRELIGSDKEVKKSTLFTHSILRNEAFLYFGCPRDWKTEEPIEIELKGELTFEMRVNGKSPVLKKKVVSDAVFIRNGYLHLIEIDNTRNMSDNQKKIQKYIEIMPHLKREVPILYFFTVSEVRKKKLDTWLKGKGIRYEVKTFAEIK